MPLIDNSYFVDQLNIPNLMDSPPVRSLLANTIRRHEKEFLKDALGIQLYNSFMLALGMLPDGSFLYVQDGMATMNAGALQIANLANNGDITLIAGQTQGFAVGTSYYIAPWLKGYGYTLEVRGTGTVTDGIDYVDNPNGGFAFPNIVLQNGQVVVIHLKTPPVVLPVSVTSPNQVWVNLLNGTDYTGLDGLPHHFAGFIDLRNTYGLEGVKISPIANLVYCKYATEHWDDMLKATNMSFKRLSQNVVDQYAMITEFLNELRYFMYSIDAITPIETVYAGWNAVLWNRALDKYSPDNTYGI